MQLLVVKWGTEWDIMAVPAQIKNLGQLTILSTGTKLRVIWDNIDGALSGAETFERDDIDLKNYVLDLIPLLTFSGGDLAYQFLLLNKKNYCSSQCMICDAKKGSWRMHKHQGTKYTMEQMVNALLTAVPLTRYLLPPLHIMLGIGNDIVTKINKFISGNLDELIKDTAGKIIRGKVHYAVHRMLAKDFNIMGQKYFTQTLVGGDIWRLLKKHEEIVPKIAAIMKDRTLRKADTAANIDVRIDRFLSKVKEIMKTFESICLLMHKTEQLTPEELVQFRKAWPNGHITPKFHQLESHGADQMEEFGCLGDKAEAAIERLHHQCNKADRQLAAMPSWKQRQTAMLRRRRQEELPSVQRALESTILGTKRKYSPASTVRRQDKIVQAAALKRTKIEVALNIGANVLANE